MKQTIHDGSRSFSIVVPNPEPGKGKHAKTPAQAYKRHVRNVIFREGLEGLKSLIKKERDN